VTFPPASDLPEDALPTASSRLPGDGRLFTSDWSGDEPSSWAGSMADGEPAAGEKGGPADEREAGRPGAEGDPATAGRRRAKKDKKGSSRSFWKELPILIVVALVVAVLIKTFLVQAFFIPSGSMNDTLLEGDRVMVNKLAYRLGDPARGDVIVFDSPMGPNGDGESIFGALVRHVAESLGLSSPESALIKRIVALGGETIEVRENQVYIDGVALDEPYLKDGSWMPDYGPFAVPEGGVFVMGDNRSSSSDSRVFGPIAEGEIVGKAFVRVWPPSRWGGL
jgi:signal peptidase I